MRNILENCFRLRSFGCGLTYALLVFLVGCSTSTSKPKPNDVRRSHDTHIALGMKYLQVGRRDQARRRFKEALEIKKKSAEAYNGLAMVHRLNGEFDLAEQSFKKATRYQSVENKAKTSYSYAQFLMAQKRYAEACKKFESAGKDLDFANRPSALYWAGHCALITENIQRAQAAFTHALNLNKQLSPAMLGLALVYFEQKNYAESKKYLDQFSEKSSHTAQSLWLGIRIERIFGNQDKEASYAIQLKNLHGYSKEYLKYKDLLAGIIKAEDSDPDRNLTQGQGIESKR